MGRRYLELDDCAFVVVEVAVVGGRKDGDYGGELLLPAPVVHLEAVGLRLVGSDHRQQPVLAQKTFG